jgi:hypothetical protein
MKTRTGFVSNSSSASFCIPKNVLNWGQIQVLHNAAEFARQAGLDSADEAEQWSITEDANEIKGFTIMDNFDMRDLFEKIGVSTEYIHGE